MDKRLEKLVIAEDKRQRETLDLIASENMASQDIIQVIFMQMMLKK
jgi:glycine/serine hydroxymethyltransferase